MADDAPLNPPPAPVQPPAGEPAVSYTFDPTALQIQGLLPKELLFLPVENDPPVGSAKYVQGLRTQRGFPCPACQYPYTEFKSNEKRDVSSGWTKENKMTADTFNCLASKVASDSIPCISCIVCQSDPTVREGMLHVCPNTNTEIAVKCRSKCQFCEFFNSVLCKCKICNICTKSHAKKFFVIANCIKASIPGGVDVWPTFPLNDYDNNKYADGKRNAFLKAVAAQLKAVSESSVSFSNAPPVTAASLKKIIVDDPINGVKFFAELERNNVGILAVLGADQETMRQVDVVLQTDAEINFMTDPFFLTRFETQLSFIKARTESRVHNLIAAMENTVRHSFTVRCIEATNNQQRLSDASRINSMYHDAASSPPQNQVLSTDASEEQNKVVVVVNQVQSLLHRLHSREKSFHSTLTNENDKKNVKEKRTQNQRTGESILQIIHSSENHNKQELVTHASSIKDADSTPTKRMKFNTAIAMYNTKAGNNDLQYFSICDSTCGYDSFDDE
jgi:hypothetical protein